MANIETVRRNERLKAFAGQLYNLGAALFAAAVVKVYGEPAFSWPLLVWPLGALILILGGHALLGMIKDEE